MNLEIRQRINMTLVIAAMIGLLTIGVSINLDIQQLRADALTKCMADSGFNTFDLCYKNSREQIRPSFFQYLLPFIPASILIWFTWLLKLDFRYTADSKSIKFLKWMRGISYFVGAVAIFIAFYIVLEKTPDRLFIVQFSDLLLAPWLASAWLSAPLLFQKLVGPESQDSDLKRVRHLLFWVIASPLLAFFLLFFRQISSL
jgi:hypothetical protein